MKVNKNSWHYNFLNYLGKVPTNTCSYFGMLFFKLAIGLVVLFLVSMALMSMGADMAKSPVNSLLSIFNITNSFTQEFLGANLVKLNHLINGLVFIVGYLILPVIVGAGLFWVGIQVCRSNQSYIKGIDWSKAKGLCKEINFK